MAREIVDTPAAPGSSAIGSPPCSQAVKAAGLVFVSGQGPFDTAGARVGVTIQEQTGQCLSSIEAILTAAGSSMANIVSAADRASAQRAAVGWRTEGRRRRRPTPREVPAR